MQGHGNRNIEIIGRVIAEPDLGRVCARGEILGIDPDGDGFRYAVIASISSASNSSFFQDR